MDENNRVFSGYDSSFDKPRKKGNILLILFIFVLLIILIASSLFFLGSTRKNSSGIVIKPTVFPTTTPLPTSSVSAVLTGAPLSQALISQGLAKVDGSSSLDRSDLSVAVLNGSGEKGAASQVSAYLKDLGYKIIRVDNADAFTYTNLTVLVKKSKSKFAGLIKSDLSGNPAFASVSASISDNISTDAQIIVGK